MILFIKLLLQVPLKFPIVSLADEWFHEAGFLVDFCSATEEFEYILAQYTVILVRGFRSEFPRKLLKKSL